MIFPDLNYGPTQGETPADAMEMAEDFLACVLGNLIKRGEPLPAPAKHRGKYAKPVSLPVLQAAKAELYLAFRASGMRKADLARNIGISKSNIERLFDFDHASRMDQLELAFLALGKRLAITLEEAA